MKNLLLAALLLVGVGTVPALAQRHVRHISSWGAHLGRSEQGTYYELSYISMLTNHLALRASGLRETGRLDGRGEYASYAGRVLLAPQLLHFGEVAYVHLLLGAAAGYERTGEHGTTELPADARQPQRFTYGPQAGAEVDVFLGNRISLVATATKGYLFNNPLLDQWPGYAGAGLRYHFR
ncbi:hypothetical protein [Hymenobacter jeollabukensis]|uniref:Conjugal transfer protein TraO n=1 Tax=Hymenobacter jeollabukensis TaxID=2025313 RepID=A0A5R8WJL6_9BACT|nr:hypothetical protein [Hymenobacter jeollabukensis]TLM88880.1 hypothetical protein FDY95_22115 [Hymenobacter jeollabukensis]